MQRSTTLALGVLLAAGLASADTAAVGQPAPAFSLPDTSGKTHSLSDYKGRFVVLEWINYECPFVGKHYGSGNMQKLQKEYSGKGVAWFQVNSSAAGKQGNYAAEKAAALTKEKGAAATAYLLDTSGTVGRAYGAKTTPHMYVIDTKGTLVYAGGIDDKPSTDQADVATAKNHVKAALDEAMAGKPVTASAAAPNGCAGK